MAASSPNQSNQIPPCHPAVDIAVLGGGPAGVAVAIGLARLGYQVSLVNKLNRRYQVQGVSRKTLEALGRVGCARAAQCVGAPVPRQVVWDGEASQRNVEFLLDRERFNAALLQDAADHGVEVLEGIVVEPQRADSGWRVPLSGEETELCCRFLVDARGRGKTDASFQRGPATVALSRNWQLSPGDPVSKVASFDGGWGWFIADESGEAILQLLTGNQVADDSERASLELRYQRLLENFPEANDWIRGGQPKGRVSACPAGVQCHPEPIGDDFVRVGDAALGADPLSGHGIYECLSGALSAIPVINTLLRKPAQAKLAQDFYRNRLQERFFTLSRMGRDFYQLEQRWSDSPFWQPRQAWPDKASAYPEVTAQDNGIRQQAVVQHGFIESAEVVVTAEYPQGVLSLSGIPLVPLVKQLRQNQMETSLADLLGQLAQQWQVPTEALRQARSWLVHNELI